MSRGAPPIVSAVNESLVRRRLDLIRIAAIVVVTLGPPGSLIGDVRIRRRLP
jgi:hypothetical protein